MDILAVPFNDSAVEYYRLYMPLLTLAEQGLAKVQFQARTPESTKDDPRHRVRVGTLGAEQRQEIIEHFGYGKLMQAKEYIKSQYESGPNAADFDLVVFNRRFEQQAAELITRIQSHGVPCVYDIDDDAFSVPRMNPAYAAWGTDGEHILYWYRSLGKAPPVSPWNAVTARRYNQNMLDGLMECCRRVDAITVTTEALAQVYRRFNSRVYVLPNQMRVSDWSSVIPMERPEDEVWFGWAGSKTHWEDLADKEDAIMQVLEAVPNSVFICLGFPEIVQQKFLKIAKHSKFKRRVRALQPMPMHEYRSVVAAMNVIWAPSAANRFNAGKSDIRVLEAWMTLNPVVATETTYGPTVREAQGGFVAKSPKDWVKYTTKLLTDEALRKSMALKGFNYAAGERSYENNAHLWEQVYSEVINRRAQLGSVAA